MLGVSEVQDIDVLKIEQILRERERLVQEARLAIKRNEAALRTMTNNAGISEEDLLAFYHNLSAADKDRVEEMRKKVAKKLEKQGMHVGQEKKTEPPTRPFSSPVAGWENPERGNELPLDALLKGSMLAAGDKKAPKKKKKKWV